MNFPLFLKNILQAIGHLFSPGYRNGKTVLLKNNKSLK